MPATRRKTLFVLVPFAIALGVYAIASEVAAHGLDVAVATGLVGGACASAAIVALIARRWGPRTVEQKAAVRRAWQAGHAPVVAGGLLVAGLISAIGAVAGNSTEGLGIFAFTGVGVVFLVTAGVLALMAIRLPQLWE